MKQKTIFILLISIFIFTPNVAFAKTEVVSEDEVTIENYKYSGNALLSMKVDEQGRAHQSHYIGSDSDQEGKRVGDTPNPINISKSDWVNFKDGNKWFWDRGHLVGNQFAGYASNNPENMVGQTYYSNQTLMTYFEGGTKSSNDNALDNWLYLHPNYVIDYIVTANYEKDSDKYPTTITLKYRGITKDSSETPVEIILPDLIKDGAGTQTTDKEFFRTVNLGNVVPGYEIDYETGYASKSNDPSESTINHNESKTNYSEEKRETTTKKEDGIIDSLVRIIRSLF